MRQIEDPLPHLPYGGEGKATRIARDDNYYSSAQDLRGFHPAMSEARIHILVVEDTEADAFLIREALTQAGLNCEAHVLDDGEKAIEFIDYLEVHESAPCTDAILLDLNLPKK